MALNLSSFLTDATEEVRAIFDRWEEVWHHGKLELVSETVGPTYVRHGAQGTRTVTAEEYREEIAATRKKMPDIRFTMHDGATQGDKVWFRWTLNATNAETGKPVTQAGLQVYRVANGKLVETWAATLSGQIDVFAESHAREPTSQSILPEVPGDRSAGAQYVWGD